MKRLFLTSVFGFIACGAMAMVDLNGNGMSDVWEAIYPGAGMPWEDPDGDGADNRSESIAGTDPLSSNSVFGVRLDFGGEGAPVAVREAVAGKRYRKEESRDLGSWRAAGETSTGLFFRASVGDVDEDGDGLNGWEERQIGTTPTEADTDRDGMPDGWEHVHELNPLADDAFGDLDGDGWDNVSENGAGTDPRVANGVAVSPVVPVLEEAMAAVAPVAGASYEWTIDGGDFTEVNGFYTIRFVASATGAVNLACTVWTGSPPAAVAAYTARVEAAAVALRPTVVAPGFATAGQTGLAARVVGQAGATYEWTIANGEITLGSSGPEIVFSVGEAGLAELVCTASVAGTSASGTATVRVQSIPVGGWETPLAESSLPPLTLGVAYDPRALWIHANMLRGCEAWLMKSDSTGVEAERMGRQAKVDERGWPLELPPGAHLEMSANYETGPDRSLHGVFVLTWEGEGEVDLSSSRNDGQNELELLNDAANGRIVKLIQTPTKHPWVFVRSSDPANPVRNMRLWAPAYDGAGLELTTSSNLARGHVAGSLEPLPGEPEPAWHPRYLEHLREAPPSGAYRFMAWQEINRNNWGRGAIEWSDRAHPEYGFSALATLDSAYTRYPVAAYRQRLGLPLEWMIDLCNEMGKDLWIQVPHAAAEDVAREMAALCAERLDPALRVWFEYSNEIWNGFGPYLPQLNHARRLAAQRFGVPMADVSTEQLAWGSGHLQGLALKAFEDEWRARGMADARLINVAAGFAMGAGYNEGVLAAVGEIDPQLAEALAITTYFGADTQFEIFGNHDFGANPGAWPEALYDATKRAVRQNLYGAAGAWRSNAEVAGAAGIPLVCYEGGQHMLPLGLGDWGNPAHVDFMNYMYDFQRSRWMGELYREQYALWCAMGGRTGSQFVDGGGWSFWGYWGAKENVLETRADSPKWDAFCAWNEWMEGVRAPSEPMGSRPALGEINLRGEAQAEFDATVAATGGDGTVRIELAGGHLPPGLTLEQGASGEARISGTPTSDGVYRFVLRALDADDDPDFRTGVISVDPAGSVSNALVVFRGQDIPATIPNNGWIGRYDPARPTVQVRDGGGTLTRMYLPFSMVDPIFGAEALEVPGTPHVLGPDSPLNMYGGWSVTGGGGATNVSAFIGLRDNQWSSWSGDGGGGATVLDALLLWRETQFNALGGSGSYGFGGDASTALLQLDMAELFGDGEILIRFAVLDGGVFYLSEAAHDTLSLGDGYFQLADFSGSDEAGKRWAAFAPTAESYAMPAAGELVFAAHAFTNVQAVGVALRGANPGWHKALNLSRFIALGRRP